MNVARLRSPVYALCLSILAIAAACGTADVAPKPKKATGTGTGGTSDTTTTGSSGSSAGGTDVVGGTTGTGGSGPVGTGGAAGDTSVMAGAGGNTAGAGVGGAGGAGGSAPLEPPTLLPVTIDTFYAASGYMGDGMMAGSIAATTTCPARAPGNIGNCTQFIYTPQAVSTFGWAGVYWQSPANNWGTLAGKRIEAGATKVTFYAAGAKGGEKVDFFASGIQGTTFQDPPKMSLPAQVLTTTMTKYTIDLTGLTYDAIIGGFGWSIEATPAGDAGTFDPTPITFYVDGIQWVK